MSGLGRVGVKQANQQAEIICNESRLVGSVGYLISDPLDPPTDRSKPVSAFRDWHLPISVGYPILPVGLRSVMSGLVGFGDPMSTHTFCNLKRVG